MLVTIAAVASADGKLTRHAEPNIYQWTSKEDWKHFQALIKDHEVILMGRKTYEAIKDWLKPDPNKRRIVLTGKPENYAGIADLEFSREKPQQLIHRLETEGVKNLLITGGSRVHAEFIAEGLVDFIHLTVEPRIFGQGNAFATTPLDIPLELIAHQKLNETGTLLLTYRVIPSENAVGRDFRVR